MVYGVTAAGTAVMEALFPETDHEMLTVYHLEGNDLVLTHYCAMGNQPRSTNRLEAEWAVYDKGKQTGSNRFFLNRVTAAAQRP